MSLVYFDLADSSPMSPASAKILKASLDYMRSPTPEPIASHVWSTPDCSGKRWDLHTVSSPVFSCPPSWLEADDGNNNSGVEDEASYPDLEVPLSSSPPDLQNSSPLSEDCCDLSTTSFISVSSKRTPVQQAKGSLLLGNLCRDDFSHRLNNLLLEAMKEEQLNFDSELTDTDSESPLVDQRNGHFGACPERQGRAPNLRDVSLSPFESRYTPESKNVLISKPLTLTYRIIKRAESNGASAYDEPTPKRQKLLKDQSIHAQDRIYARRSASLRRADSLRSDSVCKSTIWHDWTSTASATPIVTTSFPYGQNSEHSPDISKALTSAVPIIAPPEGYTSKFVQSDEMLAKIRLQRCIEREVNGRECDGLPSGVYIRSTMETATDRSFPLVFDETTCQDKTPIEWEKVLGIGRTRRHAAVKWLLDVLPIKAPGRCSSPQSPVAQSDYSPTGYSSSSTSSSTCTTTHSDSAGPSRPIHNLQDQLENSPETRFHAVWMFLRFFYLTMSPDISGRRSGHTASSTLSRTNSFDQDGLDLVVWDVAVACLSISVKFHRDFLHPLLPVFADEYINLAPHHLSSEDLEVVHRDVLFAFDYRLGITPQPIMDELWFALPSLRCLLDFHGGWTTATCKAWRRLFALLHEADIQRFLISVLTVVALMDGILETLLDHFCRNATQEEGGIECTASERDATDQLLRSQLASTAELEVEGVFCDIQGLTGITDAAVRECRLWMMRRE